VIGVGSGTLWVSVAAPSTTIEHAARVAVEHFSFCPEVEQAENYPEPQDLPDVELLEDPVARATERLAHTFGVGPDWHSTFLQYAADIVDRHVWQFWWD
jgi:hypothetical protein